MEPDVLLSCWQEPAIGPCPDSRFRNVCRIMVGKLIGNGVGDRKILIKRVLEERWNIFQWLPLVFIMLSLVTRF